MRLLVAGAIYRARGALFSTIETVAGENPLCVATSRIVTAWFFSLGRFKGVLLAGPNLSYSAGTSNDNGSRNHRVFQIPNAIPAIIQMLPTIFAGRLRLHHKPRQMKNPSTGGIRFQAFFFSARKK